MRVRAFPLVLLLAACGPDRASEPARVRLWTQPASLSRPPADAPRPALLEEDFEGGFDGWSLVSNPSQPDVADEGALAVEPGVEDGRAFVTLSGRHGGLSRLLPVEPGTCYEFAGLVRARELVPSREPFNGATFWLGELEEELPPEGFSSAVAPKQVSRRHLLPGAWKSAGWQECRTVFRTGPRARRLWVACVLGTTEDVLAGEVDFDRVCLRAIPPARYWEDRLERGIAGRASVDPPPREDGDGRGWRAARFVSASLGAEARPSIALLPGERLRFSLRLPSGSPRFTCGVGPWSESHLEGQAGAQRFALSLGGEALAELSVAIPPRAAESDWKPLERDLSRWSGRTVVLELALEGDEPGIFGAPVIAEAARRAEGKNLLLLSIDTLRADHVGAYGYEDPVLGRSPTPALDRLAREGILCRDATCQAPYTLPSHATLFTGQFPSVHRVVTSGRMISAARSSALAELLAQGGLATQAFTGGGFLAPDFGLDQGFDAFASLDPLRDPASSHFDALAQELGPQGERTRIERYGFEGVLRWLETHRAERFFLFLHTYAVHDFDAPARFLHCRERGCRSQATRYHRQGTPLDETTAPEDLAHLVHLYDAALSAVDERIGRLLARLEELDLAASTIVIATSDHGEEFLEHGSIQHGRTLYEELLRVPLILRVPGLAPEVIERAVMLADLAPTALAALSLPRDSRMQGIDFLAAEPPERSLWSEVDDAFAHKYALREASGWKLVHGPSTPDLKCPNTLEWELYHLGRDPHERENLAQREEATLARLRAALERQRALFEELGASLGAAGEGAVDERTLAELEALGYAR